MKSQPLTPARRREAQIGLMFLLPWILGIILLKVLPILLSLVLSFTNFYLLTPQNTHFVGLHNYLLFFRDSDAREALTSNLKVALTIIPIQMVAALALASALNTRYLAGRLWFRTLFFLPSIVPGVAAMYLWRGVLGQDSGWLAMFVLQPLGLDGLMGLLGRAGVNVLQVALALWSIGPGFIILLGAMQGVEPELYEAAKVDGANAFRRLMHITLPTISPALFFSLVLNLVNVFGGAPIFDRGDARSGGPSIFDGYIHSVLFTTNRLGYAASLAWLLLILTGVVIGMLFWSARYWVFYPVEEE